jgi:hypothetical protein
MREFAASLLHRIEAFAAPKRETGVVRQVKQGKWMIGKDLGV